LKRNADNSDDVGIDITTVLSKTVDKDVLIAYLVMAIQEQQRKINAIEVQVNNW
jgi:hypothetical protein